MSFLNYGYQNVGNDAQLGPILSGNHFPSPYPAAIMLEAGCTKSFQIQRIHGN